MSRATIFWAWMATRNRRSFASREALERWQDRHVRRLLRYVLPRSPFYRQHFEGLALEDWRSFPCIDKAVMMENFSELNTLGVDRDQAMEIALEAERSRDFSPTLGDVTIGLSSGTSGNRGLFIASPRERDHWAGTILAKTLPVSLLAPGQQRIAFFLRANSKLYETVGSKKIRFEFFDLLDDLAAHVARLNELQPTVLVAPPSMLLLLAAEHGAERLRIRPLKCISVAEVLDPLDRERLARAFGPIIHQIYQATEGMLGTSCAHGTVHLAEDGLVIQREYLDEAQTRFSPIVTDFRRRSQPILRYRLNDVLVLREDPCPCGSLHTALDFIEGRADDLFYLPAVEGAGYRVVFPDFLRRAISMSHSEIEAYGVRQVAEDALELYLAPGPAVTPDELRRAVSEGLAALWLRLGCRAPSLHFVDSWASGGMRKLKRVERSFEPPPHVLTASGQGTAP